jgi:plastocyanin
MNCRVWLMATAFVSVTAASGCGGGGSTATTPSAAPSSPTITIQGQNGTQAFSPNPALFGGQSVVFKNNDSVVHRIILNDGSVDTGDIPPGATSRAVTMPGTGTNYHCAVHLGMIGAVAPASGAPPPMCEGPYCTAY